MAKSIAEMLSGKGYDWFPAPPASEASIAELIRVAPVALPTEYIELLRFCNGGDGELNASPFQLQLDSIADAITLNQTPFYKKTFGDFWFIGGDGGGDLIGFDLRQGPPWAIVAIDPIAGEESIQRIAGNMAEFIPLIGIKHKSA